MANDREVKIEPSRVHFQSISYGISLSACVCFPHSSVCGGGEAGGNIAQEHLPARQRLGAHLSAGLGFISLGWKTCGTEADSISGVTAAAQAGDFRLCLSSIERIKGQILEELSQLQVKEDGDVVLPMMVCPR